MVRDIMATPEEIQRKYGGCSAWKRMCPPKWKATKRSVELLRSDEHEMVIFKHPGSLGCCFHIIPGFGCLAFLCECCCSSVNTTRGYINTLTALDKEGTMVRKNYGCCESETTIRDVIGAEYTGSTYTDVGDDQQWASIQFLNSRKAAVENALWPADLKDAVNTFLQDKRDKQGIILSGTEHPHGVASDTQAVGVTTAQPNQGLSEAQTRALFQQLQGMTPQQIQQMVNQNTQETETRPPQHIEGQEMAPSHQIQAGISEPMYGSTPPDSQQSNAELTEKGNRFYEPGVMEMESPLYSSYAI